MKKQGTQRSVSSENVDARHRTHRTFQNLLAGKSDAESLAAKGISGLNRLRIGVEDRKDLGGKISRLIVDARAKAVGPPLLVKLPFSRGAQWDSIGPFGKRQGRSQDSSCLEFVESFWDHEVCVTVTSRLPISKDLGPADIDMGDSQSTKLRTNLFRGSQFVTLRARLDANPLQDRMIEDRVIEIRITGME